MFILNMHCAPHTPIGEYLTDSIYPCAHFPSSAVKNTISVVLLINSNNTACYKVHSLHKEKKEGVKIYTL